MYFLYLSLLNKSAQGRPTAFVDARVSCLVRRLSPSEGLRVRLPDHAQPAPSRQVQHCRGDAWHDREAAQHSDAEQRRARSCRCSGVKTCQRYTFVLHCRVSFGVVASFPVRPTGYFLSVFSFCSFFSLSVCPPACPSSRRECVSV